MSLLCLPERSSVNMVGRKHNRRIYKVMKKNGGAAKKGVS